MKTILSILSASLIFSVSCVCRGALSYDTAFSTSTVNFDGLGTSGTTFPVAGVPFVGWDTDATDAALATMTSDTGSGNVGGIRNVGVAGVNAVTDRALGSQGSGTVIPAFGVNILNNTGQTVPGFLVTYRAELWRSGSGVGVTETWQFQYAVGNSEISVDTSAASWTGVSSLNMVELNPTLTDNVAKDGNASGNFATVSFQLDVTVNAGQYLTFRWVDSNDGGNDAVMAVDEFSVTSVPEPTTWAMIAFGTFFGAVQLVRFFRRHLAAAG